MDAVGDKESGRVGEKTGFSPLSHSPRFADADSRKPGEGLKGSKRQIVFSHSRFSLWFQTAAITLEIVVLTTLEACRTQSQKTKLEPHQIAARLELVLGIFLLHHFGHQHRVNHVNHTIAGFDVHGSDLRIVDPNRLAHHRDL
jgi:hypothetical protein